MFSQNILEINQLKIEFKNETRFLKDGRKMHFRIFIRYCVCNIC